MTYTTTHLALQSLIVWLLLSKQNKSYYKDHRWEYIVVSLFAMFPDIDLLFGAHRTFTHSLIIPSFILLSMLVIEKVHKEVSPIESPTRKMVRFVKLASIMWIMHIFLDLSWGPIMLFWPLDSNLYDLSIYLRFENTPWLFFPLTFAGLIPDWSIYSLSEGQNIYFINMTQQQREAIYGDYINLYIGSFTLHVTIFVVWLVVIFFPAFKRKKRKQDNKQVKFVIFTKEFWKRLKRHMTLLGLFLIFIGVLLGPSIGNNKEMDHTVSSKYKSTQTDFDPTLGVSIDSKIHASTTVVFSCEQHLVDYNVSLLLTDNDTFINFFTDFGNLTNVYYDGNITFNNLLTGYFSLVTQVKLTSLYEERLINEDVINGTKIILNATEEATSFYLITLVDEWNLTESYIYDATLTIKYNINRDVAQIEGGILDGFGLVLILIDQLLVLKEKRIKITPPT